MMLGFFKKITVWIFTINIVALILLYKYIINVYPSEKTYPKHVHTSIYIDSTFSDFEKESIIDAALEWELVTNHIIEYDIIQLPTNEPIDFDNAIIISNVTEDCPNILILDTLNKKTTLGYYDKKSIVPTIGLANRRIADEDYKSVVMHELGHALGLEHNEGVDGFDTLMYPSRYIMVNHHMIKSGADHLTLKDGIKFCQLYKCNAFKLNYL